MIFILFLKQQKLGWDRTSLVLSLIRLSLWADYELHPNLNYEQILYLTLGYDWYLFGHDLNDRVEKGEEIMHYCFYFLKFLSSTEYSIDFLRKNIVKKGDEYVRVNFNCCGFCKEFEADNTNNTNNSNKNSDEMKLSTMELDEEISSSMYSSQASTVVNNNLKKEQLLSNQFKGEKEESDTDSLCSSSDHTPKDSSNSFNGCFLAQQQEQNTNTITNNKDKDVNCDKDAVDHSSDLLTNSMISTKTFVIDPNFDANISASPSSFTTLKDLRNNSATSLNRTSLTAIENTTDLNNKFDVISLDDQSLSSNSSYDVMHNKHQQQAAASSQITSTTTATTTTTKQKQSSTPTNQSVIHMNNASTTKTTSPNQQQQLINQNNNFKPQQLHQLSKQSNNNNCELIRKDSFSCGSPPQLIQMTNSNLPSEITGEDRIQHHASKLITDEDDDDILSSSEESNTLAEDTVDSNDLSPTSNIQRSNAVAIPSRNRQSSLKFSNNDQLNWSNDYSSNNSNLSNASNKLSDQSFNLNRCDSWQMVTDTGSIRDKTFLSSTSLDEIKRNMNLKLNNNNNNNNSNNSNANAIINTTSNHNSSLNYKLKQNQFHQLINHYVPTCCCKSINCGKHCEKVNKFNKENDLDKFIYTRKKRLSDVRVVFYQCYSRYIGLSTPNASGNEITTKFSNLINKTCEKIKYPFRTGSNNGGLTRNGTRLSSRSKSNQFQSYIEDESIDLDKEEEENLT